MDAVGCFLRCPKLEGPDDYNYWKSSIIERLKLAGLHDAVFGQEENIGKRLQATSLVKLNEAMLIAEQTTDATELMNKLQKKYVTKTIAAQIKRQVESPTRRLKPDETTLGLLDFTGLY
ncbi:hypothetical protein NDN08_003747 [Rhodosorus marinus]|uniref:Uncharacterized protein n=1 Tax=Rhodosorus marinus TaxID=101924 RepID=A0AAV8UKD8_9RHOD|nr:hypothetical protein NDN08_003747 [Rhodosorus marinus]